MDRALNSAATRGLWLDLREACAGSHERHRQYGSKALLLEVIVGLACQLGRQCRDDYGFRELV